MTSMLEQADEAYGRYAWGEAYAQLCAADLEDPLDAEHLERLAITAHCLGRNDEAVDAWSRAYTAHLDHGRFEEAALAAAWCAFGLLTRGEFALGGGWLGRAQGLCEENSLDCTARWFVQGQMAAGAMFGGDFGGALPMFEETQRGADRLRAPDVQTLSRMGRGQCLVQLGRPGEGRAVFDEVLVALGTDPISPIVAGLAYCAAVSTCQESLDVRRAQEWTAALSRWCDLQPDLVPYRGNCLIHRAEILTLHGAWPEAYDHARQARDWLDEGGGPILGGAYYRLGELHRLRGEYDDAETAYKQASQHGQETQPGLGLMRLAQGHVGSATAALRRALDEKGGAPDRAVLLAAMVEVALTADDLPAARAAADELVTIARDVDVPLLTAHAQHSEGAVALAEGDASRALGLLRTAWSGWQELEAPYEAARARILIGSACRELGDDETAEMEYDAAGWVFRELGAAPDVARVQKLSRRPPREAPGGLSLREVQVLRLVAAGKPNRAIAEELFLSEKTVHRHVSNIFVKLDVGSRAAATAFAFQHHLV
jgi:DNA-binding CsgD family transcriptional regulator/tetratricopeptide (TPR) repeat protein